MNDLSTAARLDAASDAEPDLCAGVAASVAVHNDGGVWMCPTHSDAWRMQMQRLPQNGMALAWAEAHWEDCERNLLAVLLRNLRQARTIFEQADIIERRWKWLVFVGGVAWLVGAVMGGAWL